MVSDLNQNDIIRKLVFVIRHHSDLFACREIEATDLNRNSIYANLKIKYSSS